MNKYIANSCLSLVVNIDKHSHRITFDSMSNGMNIFVTNNDDEINALEHHYLYDDVFHKEQDINIIEEEDALELSKPNNVIEIEEINNIPDAILFLEKQGASESSLKTKKGILKTAKNMGYSFVNIK